MKTAVVQDPAIRKALAYAIDREKLIPTVYEGQGVTAYGLISPRFKRYYIDRKDTPLGYAYDPDKAKAALKAGGWDCSQTPCTKNGVKAQFELRHARLEHAVPAHGAALKADVAQGRHRHRPPFISDDAINNRIYASGKTRTCTRPTTTPSCGTGTSAARRRRRSWRCCSRTTRRATRSTTARRSTRR